MIYLLFFKRQSQSGVVAVEYVKFNPFRVRALFHAQCAESFQESSDKTMIQKFFVETFVERVIYIYIYWSLFPGQSVET